MATCRGIVYPIQDNQGHASDHHHYATQQETQGPNLLHRSHRFFLHQLDVEGRRKNEDQHGGRRRTNETEDVPNRRDKDDKEIGKGQDRHGDDRVAPPAELFCRTE